MRKSKTTAGGEEGGGDSGGRNEFSKTVLSMLG
jgi:hypothetical protein